MAQVYARELIGRTQSGSQDSSGSSYTRVFQVRTDCIEDISTVTGYVGVYYGTAHPEDGGAILTSHETKVADDSGLLYTVTLNYSPQKPDDQLEDSDEPGNIAGLSKESYWGASSSVSSGPCFLDSEGDIIKNSAGDALEGLSREFADYKLTLTQYYLDHADWASTARSYTNTCNNATWNDGLQHTWKCQGCSAKLQTENITDQFNVESTTKYWEVSWEFAYRKDKWKLRVWDIGFSQRVDANKTPSQSGDHRAVIKGKDGKAVKTPVALRNGMAKTSASADLGPGQPAWPAPDELEIQVYGETTFVTPFGELFT
jgi:hypothetical protein